MKKFLIGLCFMGLTSSMFGQEGVLYSAKILKEKVPVEVVSSVENDFNDYSVIEYEAVPITMIEDQVIVTKNEDFNPNYYDTYEVRLSGKDAKISAYYNADGTLESTYESIKNIALPSAIDRAVFKKYPKAKLLSDRYVSTHYARDGKTSVYYHVKIMNNGKTHRMYIDGNGNILRG
ncbi:hypothetical protein [Algibacter sp. L1A34]|uniref:hypothetical protein n=1 Tax=Algibacter sp. L1A34 TaxID=2686365 RepID=UPI00131C5609|nr:hypothetical protein [Algibacter sp. L1A34]